MSGKNLRAGERSRGELVIGAKLSLEPVCWRHQAGFVGPKQLKAVYRRDDCLGCEYVLVPNFHAASNDLDPSVPGHVEQPFLKFVPFDEHERGFGGDEPARPQPSAEFWGMVRLLKLDPVLLLEVLIPLDANGAPTRFVPDFGFVDTDGACSNFIE